MVLSCHDAIMMSWCRDRATPQTKLKRWSERQGLFKIPGASYKEELVVLLEILIAILMSWCRDRATPQTKLKRWSERQGLFKIPGASCKEELVVLLEILIASDLTKP